MNKIVIIADAACDFKKDLREQFNVVDYVHGVITRPDGTQFLADSDWENITPDEYFSSMSKGKILYKTAYPTMAETLDVFEKHLKNGEDIIAITIGTAFSGTYNLFTVVKGQLEEKYPNNKIVIIDSTRYSGALGLLYIKADELIKAGKDIDTIEQELNVIKTTIHQMGPLDDLYFLNKSGRISKPIAVMGTLVGIRPLADFMTNGFAQVLGKTKGENHALEISAEYVKEMIRDKSVVVIADSNRPKEADYYESVIKSYVNPDKIIRTSIGQFSGANIGPGLVACFFVGDVVTEDGAAEKEVLAKILAK